ncbi:type I-E CRISPR-associated protein Cas5/CasD [Salmonella enterica subsp. enterica serovar Oranienburg]|uniref:Type I-E CRISPR-associated protein Cas5/CasD n=1 Tax=Salmonella enterica TaxID=28901 RepID=A0A743TV75_SALER|nr:type I-E CRISPR-associated protein Cas5/CasD [Salmonella enterica subsp. enterica serovar Rubislaw]EAR0766530.1 type I-E CRISPR-associated protein Cas5/CasD [Salmonella enterica]EBV1275528.1 type I-E CRISPR-associated protein Cas5/CasD [Salmonella enterica subsp. enterica serovar Oranienburg]EDM1360376.1 type I-E CRISPR-associated protein Cas5/CasD [Salmonella enterica subsp. enterica serovar Newport]EDW0933227.1 type I-E CRISPR-associated protein Cas5/CasD [Salmonella enterica subsp. enteri
MKSYLVLRLSGPMQSWGQPTFEGTRPTGRFPTRSGLLGLLGACLGIQRDNTSALQALSDSVRFAVRCDGLVLDGIHTPMTGLVDYHTVQGARQDYRGLKSHETIQTWREYLCDAVFTVAVWLTPESTITLTALENAVMKPRYTPYLGRRSCPLTHPLYLGVSQSLNPHQALINYEPTGGDIYSEEPLAGHNLKFAVRDEPMITLPRQFTTRDWYVIRGGRDVS